MEPAISNANFKLSDMNNFNTDTSLTVKVIIFMGIYLAIVYVNGETSLLLLFVTVIYLPFVKLLFK